VDKLDNVWYGRGEALLYNGSHVAWCIVLFVVCRRQDAAVSVRISRCVIRVKALTLKFIVIHGFYSCCSGSLQAIRKSQETACEYRWAAKGAVGGEEDSCSPTVSLSASREASHFENS